MRAIRKVTSGELLAKQAVRKKIIICTKNMYMLKLLLNIVTAGSEALVSGSKFLYMCQRSLPPGSEATF
jgi:hypothetical protein